MNSKVHKNMRLQVLCSFYSILPLFLCIAQLFDWSYADNEVVPATREGGIPLQNSEYRLTTFRKSGKNLVKLLDDPDCKEDFKNLCGKDIVNNFSILECVQNKDKTESDLLSQKCHHLLWSYKMNLTMSGNIEGVAKDVCNSELSRFTDCKDTGQLGNTLSCLTDHLNDLQDEKCRQYLVKLATIIFSDYRLVSHMTESCSQDIEALQCGRLLSMNEPSIHSQGAVMECLSKNSLQLTADCHSQILRLAELQADDFHLDRPLYFACRDDRENFCKDVRAGHGRVYKCLMKHATDRTMSKDCADKISTRVKLAQEDFLVSQSLVRSCKSHIQALNCRRRVKEGFFKSVKLSVILLCLEDGLRRGVNIDTSCQEEMFNHRRMLMEDNLSPDLLVACKGEVKRMCNDKEVGSKILHCLMKHARLHKKFDPNSSGESRVSPHCRRVLEDTLKVSDAGEDWRVDPVLHEACQSVVERSCSNVKGGQARVMRCLMRHLDTPTMNSACESALLEIQYFVARDWKLDPQLYKACYNDSVTQCHAKRTWASFGSDADPDRGVLVLPCLFRLSYHPDLKKRISEVCSEEVRRVMHERAAYVDLHPDIESACLPQLASLCSDNTQPGQELLCLQQHLETLPTECKEVVFNYTEAEVNDVQLNSLVNTHCSSIITEMCGGAVQQSSGADGAVMECLINNKNSPSMRENSKCRAVIENFQIITLKEVSFSPKFKRDCHQDVVRFCGTSKSKREVIDCLSTRVRDDLLNDDRPQVSRNCRVQLRAQLLQRHMSVRLDPELENKCASDISAMCSGVPTNMPEILECLRRQRRRLSLGCHQVIFRRAQEEILDPGTDPVLLMTCEQMIKLHCSLTSKEDVLTCLKREKSAPSFDRKCRNLVVSRLIEQSSDARLNPELLSACHLDIARHCASIFANYKTSKTEMNGKLFRCLQESLIRKNLTRDCSDQVVALTREAALNYKMDAQLTEACGSEIPLLCQKEAEEESSGGQGAVEECLKLALEQHRIKDATCQQHVAEIIETQRMDLHADPVLHRACAVDDTKFCADQEPGSHLFCLFDVLDRNHDGLERECRELLRKRREMFKYAVKVSRLESFDDIVQGVVTSSHRNYLLLVFFSIVLAIFAIGLLCGRSTRRYRLLKNR